MRQLTAASNLVLAAVAGAALALALGLPWYAPPATDLAADGQMERMGAQIARVFDTVEGATTGTDAFGATGNVLYGLAGVVAVLCLAMAVPALRDTLRDVLRAAGLLAPVVVAFLVVGRPGDPEGQLHWGAVIALLVSGFLASTCWHGAAIRSRRVAPGGWAARRAR